MKGARIRRSNVFQTSNKIVDLDNENQLATHSKKREKSEHCAYCWNYEIHSMKCFLPKYQPKLDRVHGKCCAWMTC